MNLTISRKMGFGFGVLSALVATLAIVVLFHLADMNRQFSFVIQHDAPVIANARHLLTLIVDMETGQRGFVITGKDEFLEPYEKALDSFADLLKEEKALVSDNPPQVKLLEEIEASVQAWEEKAARPEIAMRRKVGEATVDADHLQEILSRGVGKRLMDRFMALGHEIELAFRERGDWEGAFTVEVIEKYMADREDGQRGFLITGKEEFLEKYTAGEQKKLPVYFANLRAVVSDRSLENELTEKIDRLEQLAAEWSHKAAEPEITARRIMNKHPESLKDVAALLEVGTGKRILDRIRAVFRKFIEEEEGLTAKRFAAASQASRSTSNTTILLALVSVIFGRVMVTKITRGITKPVCRLTGALGMVAKGDLSQEIEIKSEDEIGELSRSFNQMVDNLKRLEKDRKQGERSLRAAKDAADYANQAKSAFLASMSHEIRIPLHGILSFARFGKDKALTADPEKLLDYFARIDTSGQRLLVLLSDIHDLAKMESGSMRYEFKSVDPSTVLRSVQNELHSLLADRNITIDYAEPGAELRLTLDENRMAQVVRNLLSNAAKFSADGGTIWIDVNEDDEGVHVSIRDHGMGIPEEELKTVFDKFVQSSKTRTGAGGTGLGLSICREIVEAHEGSIWCENHLEGGALFHVVLPWTMQGGSPNAQIGPLGRGQTGQSEPLAPREQAELAGHE